jgi:hypothetical protein
MVGLVVLEGLIIALLGLLVIALLRSHGEILRRLERIDPGGSSLGAVGAAQGASGGGAGGVVTDVSLRSGSGAAPATVPGVAPPRPGPADAPAADVTGVRPNGATVVIGVVGAGHPTLLAFLTTGCATCAGFWDAFGAGAASRLRGGTTLVAVTKGPESESPAAVSRLAPPEITTVMSTAAWDTYGIPVSPYFVLADGPSGRVIGEGAAATWEQMISLLERVWDDAGWVMSTTGQQAPSPGRRRQRESLVDADLLAAGIAPGHPSLYGDPLAAEDNGAPRT